MLIPDMYKKSIFDINYPLLKSKGIKCLIFDLDNTLALIDDKNCPDKVKELVKKLKKDFRVLIISNNTKNRLKPYKEELDIDAVSFAMKPLTKGLRQIVKKYKLEKNEMVMIGDQIPTDILSGKRFNIMTILVEPLAKKDLKITSLNRIIEKRLIKKYEKRGLFKKGEYYE